MLFKLLQQFQVKRIKYTQIQRQTQTKMQIHLQIPDTSTVSRADNGTDD